MKKYPNLILALAFAAAVAVAALQGRRVDHIREATEFYRWILSASTQWRVLGADLEALAAAENEYAAQEGKTKVDWMDNELFQEIQATVESQPDLDVPETPNDVDAQGNVQPKLVRMVERAKQDTSDEDQPAEMGEGAGIYDQAIWKFASGQALASQRDKFLTYKREGRLASLGTAFTAQGMYDEDIVTSIDDPTVSMTQMFFGFRKMAANLLWLQVDKYWHAGMLHRMVPLMKTTVALDPNFVDAFLLGAWHLAYNATAQLPETPEALKVYSPHFQARLGEKEKLYYQAVDFLKDGIQKNPRNYKLYFDLGFSVYELKLNDYANAVKYLSEAIRYKHDRWVPRQLAIAQQKNGEYNQALAGWKRYLEQYPDNPNAPRFIKTNEALIIEQEAEKAQEAGDEARAKELRDKARAVWNELITKEEDPYALMRTRRMDALDLARQGRYLEARGLLDQARYETPAHFDMLSNLLIKVEKQGNLPLSLSEKMYLRRKADENQFVADELKRITGKAYEIREDVWYEEGYNNEPTTLLAPGESLPESKALKALKAKHEILPEMLSFRQPIVFKLDNTWYRYRPTVE